MTYTWTKQAYGTWLICSPESNRTIPRNADEAHGAILNSVILLGALTSMDLKELNSVNCLLGLLNNLCDASKSLCTHSHKKKLLTECLQRKPHKVSPLMSGVQSNRSKTFYCQMCIGSRFMSSTGNIKLLGKQTAEAQLERKHVDWSLFTGWWLYAPVAGFAVLFLSCKQEKAGIL